MLWLTREKRQRLRQSDCLFCKIIHGELPSGEVFADEQCKAFNDINPVAKVHVLIVPLDHITHLTGTTERHENLLGHMIRVGAKIARDTHIAEGGYRLAVNQGSDAGQIVDHLHIHLLGGGRLDPLGVPFAST
jgi:histidine triad (HIT) family protein